LWGLSHYTEGAPPHKYPFPMWFRGEKSVAYHPTPGVFRDGDYRDETSMWRMALIRYTKTHSQTHHSTLDWLTLMQHHGIPTRLLDWSSSMAVALWFAVYDNHSECDAAVWVINAARLNYHTSLFHRHPSVAVSSTFDATIRGEMAINKTVDELLRRKAVRRVDDYDAPTLEQWVTLPGALKTEDHQLRRRLSLPTAFYPTSLSGRIGAQLSMFTVAGGKTTYEQARGDASQDDPQQLPLPGQLVELSKSQATQSLPFLGAIRIHGERKKDIEEELSCLGLTPDKLFPDIATTFSAIKGQFSYKRHDPDPRV
jgi:hypothetical protein